MKVRATGRSRNQNSDSQLDFLALVFQSGDATPSPPAGSPPLPLEKRDADDRNAAVGQDLASPKGPHQNISLENEAIRRSETSVVAETVLDSLKFEPIRNEQNYRITDADRIGVGSLKSKCRANLKAIELLKQTEVESRQATQEEKAILVRYTGWGGLPQVFDDLNEGWCQEREKLGILLTPEELESARATTLNAHYTSVPIIKAMYAALVRFGFEHGRILEPACGIGHFIGLMPDEMHSRSQITAVEIDSVSARIATKLYPDADIRHQAFEDTKLPDGFFDVAISNIPFGDYKPYDPRFKSWNFPIHDYFFAAALEKVRPGGLLLFVTSRGTMDKNAGAIREYIASHADLLGAIRLPNDAFKRNANTEVTTDILMLQKRGPSQIPKAPPWREIVPITNSSSESIPVNEYFAARPYMMLGEMRLEGRLYRSGEPTLVGTGRELGDELAAAIAQLPTNLFRPIRTPSSTAAAEQKIPAPSDIKPNAFALINGDVAIREGDSLRKIMGPPALTSQRIRGLVRVRDAVRRCLASQLEATNEDDVVSSRLQLNQTYDTFFARFGPISESANVSAFRSDPDLPLLLSLERYDSETKKVTKAAIFTERTIRRNVPISEVQNPKDALLITLNARGNVDLEYISGVLHQSSDQFLPDLSSAIFLNPQTNQWETEDAYLSGNVRAKLAAAEAASLVDKKFDANVTALETVQPVDLLPSEIDARLGSTWVSAEDVKNFAEDLLRENGVRAAHVSELGLWQLRGGAAIRGSVANTTEFGTERRSALELIEDALNLRTPTVFDHDPDQDRDIVNVPATEAARDKQEKIKERFKSWVWQDVERSERLARIYNDQFNSVRLRTFNGDHLTLPGASPIVTLRAHQKACVWRILQTPNCLAAHVVGAGKTYTMITAAVELKRLGLAQKPLITVPNHMLGQFASAFLTLYPAANILVATQEDFEKVKRQTLMSRIATGNWDAVIVTHSGFEKIPVSRATQEEFFKEQLRELSLAIEQQRQDENSRIVKTLERAKKRLDTRLKELAAVERKDDTINFEELGVDRLFVDEAHYFKNLFYVSKMTRIAGLPQTASQRAMDMFLKVCHVQRQNQGGGVVFATGTPIANSVAEMFTMQRYLQMTALKALHIEHFDSWAATFGEPVTAMELSPDGSGYRLNTRFARFINVPELMQQFRQVADIQTQEMLKLPVPDLKRGKPEILSAPSSPELRKIVESLVKRAEALKSGLVDPRDDNMLLVTTDGRKAALDLRLYDSALPDHPRSKVNLAVSEIYKIWLETKESCATQLVFCDLSIPTGGKGFSVYEDMRNKLIDCGVPDSEVAFIQDYTTDSAKLSLFQSVCKGRLRILFGSTQKMGTGTNVQERLIALHHLDAPWRPADVEQREGRILRQGNQNKEIQIFRYVTEASFDAYMWQTLETKAKFISQVMTGQSDLRRIEDVDGAALTYAEVKAIASGNPLVIEKANVDAEVARLTRLHTQYQDGRYKIRYRIAHLTEDLPRFERRLEAIRVDLKARQDTRGDAFVIQIDGQTIRDRGIAGEIINRHAARINGTHAEREIGNFAGFKLVVASSLVGNPPVLLKGAFTHEAKISDSAHGTMRSIEYAVQYMEEMLLAQDKEIVETRKRISDLTEQGGRSFDYADRLAELVKRQQEISDALDLTKNQAASQLASDVSQDASVASEAGAMRLGEIGFSEYEE